MRPTILTEHANDKSVFKDFRLIGIVVTDGGDSAGQIANATPPHADFSRHLAVLSDQSMRGAMNVLGPFEKIPVIALPHAREERKFEMIVCVDQAGKKQQSGEVRFNARRLV